MSKAFSYQDLRKIFLSGFTPGAWSDKNTLRQIGLRNSFHRVISANLFQKLSKNSAEIVGINPICGIAACLQLKLDSHEDYSNDIYQVITLRSFKIVFGTKANVFVIICLAQTWNNWTLCKFDGKLKDLE